jgi:hypothetical protein
LVWPPDPMASVPLNAVRSSLLITMTVSTPGRFASVAAKTDALATSVVAETAVSPNVPPTPS